MASVFLAGFRDFSPEQKALFTATLEEWLGLKLAGSKKDKQ